MVRLGNKEMCKFNVQMFFDFQFWMFNCSKAAHTQWILNAPIYNDSLISSQSTTMVHGSCKIKDLLIYFCLIWALNEFTTEHFITALAA